MKSILFKDGIDLGYAFLELLPHLKYSGSLDHSITMLIFSAFKTLTNQVVTVELKNDVAVTGTLKSVDQFLNFRIDNMKVVEGDESRWPHLAAVKSAFIRGSVIRYVHIPASAVDTTLLEDATRREATSGKR